MSSNSSKPQTTQTLKRNLRTVGLTLGFGGWTIGSVFVVGALIGGTLYASILRTLGIDESINSNNTSQTIVSVIIYMFGLMVLLIEPYAVRRMAKTAILTLLGILRRPIVRDLGYALVAWAGYMISSIILSVIAQQLIPGLNMDQEQAIGFEARQSFLDILMAFVAIVIAAPLVEELIFRGYFYGSIRPRMPWWLAAIIVSIAFGFVHGQWNVGIDVFAMSMVSCYLRERTGAIWSGVALHMVKNLLAFTVLFLLPEPLRQLIMTM